MIASARTATVLTLAILAHACGGTRVPPNFVPLEVRPFDNAPRPWCHETEPSVGGSCIECAHKRSDYWPATCKVYRVHTWPGPTATPTQTPTEAHR